jgi:hypothetical protein
MMQSYYSLSVGRESDLVQVLKTVGAAARKRATRCICPSLLGIVQGDQESAGHCFECLRYIFGFVGTWSKRVSPGMPFFERIGQHILSIEESNSHVFTIIPPRNPLDPEPCCWCDVVLCLKIIL